MDHTGNLTSVFRLYRQTISAISHGDHRILQIRTGRSVYHGVQGIMHFVIHLAHGSANLQKCRAGIISHLIVSQNAAADLRSQGRNRIQKFKGFIQRITAGIISLPLSILSDLSGSFQQ